MRNLFHVNNRTFYNNQLTVPIETREKNHWLNMDADIVLRAYQSFGGNMNGQAPNVVRNDAYYQYIGKEDPTVKNGLHLYGVVFINSSIIEM